MSYRPLVSAVIPVYNRRDLVIRAIRSVCEQAYEPLEIIVVDDGSTDDTSTCVQQQFGSKVRVLRLGGNSGVSAARNAGINAARGEWIAMLDSDDAWRSEKLSRQMDGLLQTGQQVCHTGETWIRDGVEVPVARRYRKSGGDIFLQALEVCAMAPSSLVVHCAVFSQTGLFDEQLPVCEDYELFLRITSTTEVLLVQDPLTVKYAGHADQLSRNYPAMDQFRVQALDAFLRSTTDLRPAYRCAAIGMLLRRAVLVRRGALRRGNTELAIRMKSYLDCWVKSAAKSQLAGLSVV